jgi:hypothetical protein
MRFPALVLLAACGSAPAPVATPTGNTAPAASDCRSSIKVFVGHDLDGGDQIDLYCHENSATITFTRSNRLGDGEPVEKVITLETFHQLWDEAESFEWRTSAADEFCGASDDHTDTIKLERGGVTKVYACEGPFAIWFEEGFLAHLIAAGPASFPDGPGIEDWYPERGEWQHQL